MQMPPVPGQQEPGQAEPTPGVIQPTPDTAPAPNDGGVGLPVAGQAETVTPEVPAQPPVQFSDLTNTEAQGGSAQVEAAAAAPVVPSPPLPEASPFPPSEGVQPPSPDSAPLQSPVEAPAAGNAQDAAEQARADTTVHIGDELSAVGSEMAQGGAAPLPPQEIGAEPVALQPSADVALPPEPPSGPIEPTEPAQVISPEGPIVTPESPANESDVERALMNLDEDSLKVQLANTHRMIEQFSRYLENASPEDALQIALDYNRVSNLSGLLAGELARKRLHKSGSSSVNPVEAGQAANQVG